MGRSTCDVIGDSAADMSTMVYRLRRDIQDDEIDSKFGWGLIDEIERARAIIREVRRCHYNHRKTR